MLGSRASAPITSFRRLGPAVANLSGKRRLVYAPRARDDIDAARRWLAQPGAGSAAWRTLTEIIAAVQDLREHPCRFPFGQHPGVRERLCAGGYRALYRVRPDTGRDDTAGEVRVLRVFGPGQDRRHL